MYPVGGFPGGAGNVRTLRQVKDPAGPGVPVQPLICVQTSAAVCGIVLRGENDRNRIRVCPQPAPTGESMARSSSTSSNNAAVLALPPTYEAALAEPVVVKFSLPEVEVDAHYVAEMVRAEMVNRYGHAAYTGGYRVVATIDGKRQDARKVMLQPELRVRSSTANAPGGAA